MTGHEPVHQTTLEQAIKIMFKAKQRSLKMDIKRSGSQPFTKGLNEYFTGVVRIHLIKDHKRQGNEEEGNFPYCLSCLFR